MNKMKKILKLIPNQFIIPLFLLGGIAIGLTGYIIYISRAHAYLSDEPSGCINCHIMTPYYHSWMNSSHGKNTTCNDCHVPQDNAIHKYAFKAIDGLYHSAVFTMRAEPDVIRPRDASCEVIMNNCIRCHTQLNTEFVKTGMIDYAQTKNGEGKKCWDCHRDVPHTMVSNVSSAPNAIVPMPESPVPAWLKKMINNKKPE
ncbi:MAG: cytochrome c nitrite reductase small subunit [Bacteroidales bacterium]